MEKLRSPNFIFSPFFFQQELEKENQDRASMGFPVPVHPQLPYPVSLVSVIHREPKYAAPSSVEKLWDIKKEFVPLGEVNENISGKYSYFCICKGFPDTAYWNPALQSGLQTLVPGARIQ